MKLSEIIAHNKANLERCTKKQADCMRNNMPGLDEDENTTLLFNSVLITVTAYVTDYKTFRRTMMILYVVL